MEPVTIFWILVTVGALIAFWPHIVDWLSNIFIPFLRKVLGNRVADRVADLVVFLDKGICSTRELLKAGWKSFKQNVLGMRSTYEKIDAQTAKATHETYVRTEDNRIMKSTTVEDVPWAEIPPDIRQQMVAKRKKSGVVDTGKVVEEKMVEQCEAAGILDLRQ
jgi:hypothetical protein